MYSCVGLDWTSRLKTFSLEVFNYYRLFIKNKYYRFLNSKNKNQLVLIMVYTKNDDFNAIIKNNEVYYYIFYI